MTERRHPLSNEELRQLETDLEYRRLKRKGLINCWADGGMSSEELHEALSENTP